MSNTNVNNRKLSFVFISMDQSSYLTYRDLCSSSWVSPASLRASVSDVRGDSSLSSEHSVLDADVIFSPEKRLAFCECSCVFLYLNSRSAVCLTAAAAVRSTSSAALFTSQLIPKAGVHVSSKLSSQHRVLCNYATIRCYNSSTSNMAWTNPSSERMKAVCPVYPVLRRAFQISVLVMRWYRMITDLVTSWSLYLVVIYIYI